MKYLQNIILIIILLFCTAKQCNSVEYTSTERILEALPTNSENNSNSFEKKYILLSSTQNLISLGEEGGINVSVRVQYSNERNHSAKKTPFKFIKNAIEYEAKRQIEILENGGTIDRCTMRYNQGDGTTSVLRSKEDALDYRYFPDPDLLPVVCFV